MPGSLRGQGRGAEQRQLQPGRAPTAASESSEIIQHLLPLGGFLLRSSVQKERGGWHWHTAEASPSPKPRALVWHLFTKAGFGHIFNATFLTGMG